MRRRGSTPARDTAWRRAVEQDSLARAPGDAAPAYAAFLGLPRAEQMELVEELVATRRGEIVRAYADVISVSEGHRVTGDAATGSRRVEPEVCVTVVVKKKWRKDAPGPPGRRVPEYLFAYWGAGGQRTLCAVRTDVADGQRLGRIRPQGQIRAEADGQRVNGVVACAITRDDDTDTVFAIGCRHVFGMGLVLDPAEHYAAEIRLVADGGEVGRATPLAGRLGNGPELSFDSHLARVLEHDTLRTALDGILPAVPVREGDLRSDVVYWMHTPHGVLRVQYVGPYRDRVWYADHLPDIRHAELARFQVLAASTVKGDSGAPVTTDSDGGALVGMHIAGNSGDSLVIPAWQLLDASRYDLSGETWTLWPG